MIKIIYNFAIDQFNIFENPVNNYIAMGIILFIAFIVAYKVVGSLYDGGLIEGSAIGSILHWVIRFFVVVMLFTAVSVIIFAIKWVMNVPILTWCTYGGLIIVIISSVKLKRGICKKSV